MEQININSFPTVNPSISNIGNNFPPMATSQNSEQSNLVTTENSSPQASIHAPNYPTTTISTASCLQTIPSAPNPIQLPNTSSVLPTFHVPHNIYTPPSILTGPPNHPKAATSLPQYSSSTCYPVPPPLPPPPAVSSYQTPQQPIYCSDGVVYPHELQQSTCATLPNVISGNSNNGDTNNEDNIVSLPEELIDVYNHLGIVGKILTGGSLVTIRFLQMFRAWSETFVDALGITKPKYEGEIQAYEDMKREEQQRQEEVQQLYATWKPPLETMPFRQQPPPPPPAPMTNPVITPNSPSTFTPDANLNSNISSNLNVVPESSIYQPETPSSTN